MKWSINIIPAASDAGYITFPENTEFMDPIVAWELGLAFDENGDREPSSDHDPMAYGAMGPACQDDHIVVLKSGACIIFGGGEMCSTLNEAIMTVNKYLEKKKEREE